MSENGKPIRHPLLGLVADDDHDDVRAALGDDPLDPVEHRSRNARPSARRDRPQTMVGMLWDDEMGEPVAPPPPEPPIDIAAEAEEAEPGVRTLLRKVAGAALRRLARKFDPDA